MGKLTKQEIEEIAKALYPENWESHYPTNMYDDGWTDLNEDARRAFIKGMEYGNK